MAIALVESASLPGSSCIEAVQRTLKFSRAAGVFGFYRYISWNCSGARRPLASGFSRISLWAIQAWEKTAELGRDPVNSGVESQNTPKPHVLVAEDDLPLANFLRRQLESESYDVNLVQDGEAAAEVVAREKY